ncbi:MAG: hypothetical protein ACK5JR_21135 [Tropicimonas sp.]|uniref:hypothetical protein n=1 Tax=Tropicimonas sp. TaxID=2067044 RepID=UPI003A8542B9
MASSSISLWPTRAGHRWFGGLLLAFCLIVAPPASAQKSSEGFLPVLGKIADDGSAVELSWPDAKPPRAGNVVVRRRGLGETGVRSWKIVAPKLGATYGWRDGDIRPGIAYEYRIQREDIRTGQIIDAGYWTGGTRIPAVEQRGTTILVIDETVTAPLAPWLDRFEMDLVGDGWNVRRLSTPRGQPADPVATLRDARALKLEIRDVYWRDPFGGHALILVGHVPMVLSGRAAPDGHEPVPHGTDLFYADITGNWPDDGSGRLLPNHVVGGAIAMPVGRIDFSTPKGMAQEISQLQSYFDRNHAWRQGYHGDLREGYGNTGHLLIEQQAVKNIVGPQAYTTGGHHDVGEQHPWLIGVDFGDWQSGYAERYANKAVFAINFGSHKQKIQNRGNQMNELLALPWYPLAVGWGARPAWWLHPMALGRSMGDAQMRTVNNGRPDEPYPDAMEYIPTGGYVWRNPVWLNLLGDPTAHAFPLAPPRAVEAHRDMETVTLTWQPSPDGDVTGYRIYRATARTGPYQPLTPAEPLAATTFTDSSSPSDAWYMIRADGLKKVNAGSIFTLSQGVFVRPGQAPVEAPDITLSAAAGVAGTAIPVLTVAAPDAPALLRAPIHAPSAGRLRRERATWLLEPPAGFAGAITFPYFASDGLSSARGEVSVTLGGK